MRRSFGFSLTVDCPTHVALNATVTDGNGREVANLTASLSVAAVVDAIMLRWSEWQNIDSTPIVPSNSWSQASSREHLKR